MYKDIKLKKNKEKARIMNIMHISSTNVESLRQNKKINNNPSFGMNLDLLANVIERGSMHLSGEQKKSLSMIKSSPDGLKAWTLESLSHYSKKTGKVKKTYHLFIAKNAQERRFNLDYTASTGHRSFRSIASDFTEAGNKMPTDDACAQIVRKLISVAGTPKKLKGLVNSVEKDVAKRKLLSEKKEQKWLINKAKNTKLQSETDEFLNKLGIHLNVGMQRAQKDFFTLTKTSSAIELDYDITSFIARLAGSFTKREKDALLLINNSPIKLNVWISNPKIKNPLSPRHLINYVNTGIYSLLKHSRREQASVVNYNLNFAIIKGSEKTPQKVLTYKISSGYAYENGEVEYTSKQSKKIIDKLIDLLGTQDKINEMANRLKMG